MSICGVNQLLLGNICVCTSGFKFNANNECEQSCDPANYNYTDCNYLQIKIPIVAVYSFTAALVFLAVCLYLCFCLKQRKTQVTQKQVIIIPLNCENQTPINTQII
ncbi:Hypothetical_protein [Hexamita inflata]|uniref:Hypothetical_protein n=1 Tax=Hexamita inflata TaxID=28002 RepID=A0AA86VID7_9EUKA|nr:Hypothetical protein HINF_LOCUS55248 [Hexamita inflata]CAI9974005.1 Hypothetical protein HINF_LOCUS61650 [Hexamita inflata]